MPNPNHAIAEAAPFPPVRRAYIPPDLTYETCRRWDANYLI